MPRYGQNEAQTSSGNICMTSLRPVQIIDNSCIVMNEKSWLHTCISVIHSDIDCKQLCHLENTTYSRLQSRQKYIFLQNERTALCDLTENSEKSSVNNI